MLDGRSASLINRRAFAGISLHRKRVIPRSSRNQADPQRDRWMVSYLDVVTVLLIFFVAAAAQKVPVRPKDPDTPVHVAVPPAPPPPKAETAQDLLIEQAKKAGLEARQESRGVVVSLPQAILFSSGD